MVGTTYQGDKEQVIAVAQAGRQEFDSRSFFQYTYLPIVQ